MMLAASRSAKTTEFNNKSQKQEAHRSMQQWGAGDVQVSMRGRPANIIEAVKAVISASEAYHGDGPLEPAPCPQLHVPPPIARASVLGLYYENITYYYDLTALASQLYFEVEWKFGV